MIIIQIRVLVKTIVKSKYSSLIVSLLRIRKEYIFVFIQLIEGHMRTPKTGLSTTFDHNEEKWYIVASQVFIPFMIAGFGMVAAGLVLERVKVKTNLHSKSSTQLNISI